MENFSDYLLQEKIYETRNSIIYRGKKQNEPQSFIIKVLKTQYPSPSEIARFKQEYNLIKSLDIEGVIKTFDLVEYNDRYAIIEEDFDGISLKEILKKQKPGLKVLMQIAAKVSEILGTIHQKDIIHLDIKPDNILINVKQSRIKITDFGISAVLTHANDAIYNPDVIEGTLAYMSPEQTGRMNRSVDYRTDLYSLGITFYEMLTGTVPFKTRDPMELIHSHIARKPVPPVEADSSIPLVISDIIMKLLSKTPEERYQNSLGLAADIKECLNQLNQKGIINEFPIATKDISIRFTIPQIFIGREKELGLLMEAFERISKGTSGITLVQGQPGIGKSALVNEIHKPIVAKMGYFISGKYEQFRKDVPYSSIIQAFQGLIRQILSESDERIKIWKENFLAALGPNGKVISGVIPELELIIGKQPDIAALGLEESQNRFNFVFQSFVAVFTVKDHPLVIFLDDLQWADQASLNLLKTIITSREKKHLFIIGAYRDNEVSLHHPLSITLDEIRKCGREVCSILLGPLDAENVNLININVLRCKSEKSMPLAELITKKTGGNPFFVSQFLKNLYDSRILELDPRTGWVWDINRIEQMQVTDNVVEFMAGKISKLGKDTQNVLKICACVGNRFDLETLSFVSGKSIEETLADLTTAVQDGLVSLYGDMYKFHHDRIQEAAYSLIPEDEKAEMHYRIGNNVLKKTNETKLSEKIFYIVDQLNRGIEFVCEADERIRLAELNLTAAQKAKNSTAYVSALAYLKTGAGLLPEDCWERQYELAYALYRERMECEYLVHNFDQAVKLFQVVLKNAKSNLDKANLYIFMVILYTNLGNYKEALRLGIEGKRIIGFKTPGKVNKGKVALDLLKLFFKFGRRKIEDVVDIPFTENRTILAFHLLHIAMGNVAFYINPYFFSYLIIDGVSKILKYGNIEYSAVSFSSLGIIIGASLGLYEKGYRFGKIALKLEEKIKSTKDMAKVKFIFAAFIQHWMKHAEYDLDFYREAYKDGLQGGDLMYSSHSINALGRTRIILGDNIDEVLEEYGKYRDFQIESKDVHVGRNYRENTQMCLCLKGLTDNRTELNTKDFDAEDQMQCYRKEGNLLGIYFLISIKIRILYLFGKYSECLPFCEEFLHLRKKNIGNGYLEVSEINFYSSLMYAALYPAAGTREKTEYKKLLKHNQKQMKIWANNGPENFLHKYLLVEAEMARIKGDHNKAVSYYDQAIQSAHENKYTQNGGIANERAALFMKEISNTDKARQYMNQARYCYIKWGATAKVKDLEEKYHELIEDKIRKTETKDSTTSTSSSSVSGSQTLDLSTVIKASQALSSEIDQVKLLESIMKLSIENAGAQHGYLILENETNNKLFIEAAGRVDEPAEVLKSVPVEGNGDFSASIVHYVNKTGENIVLNDAAIDERFINDPYIIQKRPKSILCVPIKHKGAIIGIVYLENNLTTFAFTPERVELLQVFFAQAAISIENSRLIAQREKAIKLHTEMKIAANIQTALLPDNPAIEGFDIAAYMKPADDVGGDYYDVINSGDKNWVVIGDVSGHGVPAGLVMMMVQTTIQALVRKYPDLKPSELLSIVNEAIKYNVSKMNEDKYMTITTFSFEKEGNAYFSGLHQDLLVFRASSGDVETIPSEGIWLSTWDLNQKNIDGQLKLAPGDVLLLYTDGITEAKTESKDEFKVEKLSGILKSSGRLTPDTIKLKILESLQGYHTNDDVTMVILKKR